MSAYRFTHRKSRHREVPAFPFLAEHTVKLLKEGEVGGGAIHRFVEVRYPEVPLNERIDGGLPALALKQAQKAHIAQSLGKDLLPYRL